MLYAIKMFFKNYYKIYSANGKLETESTLGLLYDANNLYYLKINTSYLKVNYLSKTKILIRVNKF